MPKRDESPAADAISVQPGARTREPLKQRFPVTDPAAVALRVVMDKEAFADLIQHAKESLAAEICGVVVGRICHDDQGLWVDVSGTVRGSAASGGSSHVTFTQETWTAIHAEKERRFPAAEIVGWYHSHPGFGVEFSEMDTFIHRNFFPGAAQIAVLTDPISGEDAICMNAGEAIRYLERFWVDGRERRLRVPGAKGPEGTAASGPGQARIDALEARVAQMVGALDDMRDRIWSFYLIVGMVVLLIGVGWLSMQIYGMYAERLKPPELISKVSLPVRMGEKDVMMLAHIYGWEVPAELNSLMLQQIELERQRREQAEEDARKAREEALKKAKEESAQIKDKTP